MAQLSRKSLGWRKCSKKWITAKRSQPRLRPDAAPAAAGTLRRCLIYTWSGAVNKPQFKLIITADPGTKRWMMELGRGIVFFGVLERLMLDWAALLRCDPKLLAKHQKSDMKKIARLLHKAVQDSNHGVPPAARKRALAAVKRAERLTNPRNDIAHSRVRFMPAQDGTHVPIGLVIAKPLRAGRRVFALRRLEWLVEFVQEAKATTKEMQAAMEGLSDALAER